MRYCKIYDTRQTRLYRNKIALIVYYDMVIRADITSQIVTISQRKYSMDINITIQQLRTALRALEREGLIKVTNRRQYTEIQVHPSINITPAPPARVDDALATLRTQNNKIENLLLVQQKNSLYIFYEQFVKIQTAGGKTWATDEELIKHFCNWYNKSKQGGRNSVAAQITAAASREKEREIITQETVKTQAIIDEHRRTQTDWKNKILQARQAASEGNPAAVEFLNNKYTIAKIKALGL